MTPATQQLHWQLLRLLKGAATAYETWLRAESGPPPQAGHSIEFIERKRNPRAA